MQYIPLSLVVLAIEAAATSWRDWLPYGVLLLVAIRESLLLATGLGAKRRTDNTSGGQSIEAWELRGRKLVEEAMRSHMDEICKDLDELLRRDRRNRR